MTSYSSLCVSADFTKAVVGTQAGISDLSPVIWFSSNSGTGDWAPWTKVSSPPLPRMDFMASSSDLAYLALVWSSDSQSTTGAFPVYHSVYVSFMLIFRGLYLYSMFVIFHVEWCITKP